jgi:transcriptional regulator with XRE-family HTH domain
MTSEQFKAAIETLELTLSDAATLLGVHPRTTSRWANAERKVPPPAANFLHHLAEARAKSAKATRAPKARKTKSRVGPTFVAKFADGEVTRMSVFSSLENLDWARGIRLSQAAYQSRRTNGPQRKRYHTRREIEDALAHAQLVAPAPPAIVSAHFEQDGKVLAQREF